MRLKLKRSGSAASAVAKRRRNTGRSVPQNDHIKHPIDVFYGEQHKDMDLASTNRSGIKPYDALCRVVLVSSAIASDPQSSPLLRLQIREEEIRADQSMIHALIVVSSCFLYYAD
eukprot:GHVU01001145.1.p1 GENE.GHVU01001145.1~~GHVU01001145.1.p1  ORF type:complete len:115 (+),score=5.16 GHVU01001145.1:247-591(+)